MKSPRGGYSPKSLTTSLRLIFPSLHPKPWGRTPHTFAQGKPIVGGFRTAFYSETIRPRYLPMNRGIV